MTERLDKLISSRSALSRSEIKMLVRQGRILINGSPAKKPETKVAASSDRIIVDGKLFVAQSYIYIMLNKPAGVLSAATDKSRKTVVDLVPDSLRRKGLFPVGRLDIDTTGFLIITNDGDFAHRVISPKSKIPKVYIAVLDAPLGINEIKSFAMGIHLADGTACMPAELKILKPGQNPTAEITVFEGKYHQVKRMFGALGIGVTSLHREQIGLLPLDSSLESGTCRELSEYEIKKITSSGKV